MRRQAARDIEAVELQILRLLSVRDELIELETRANEQPDTVEEFVAGIRKRCSRLARKHELDQHLAAFLVPTGEPTTGAPARDGAAPGDRDARGPGGTSAGPAGAPQFQDPTKRSSHEDMGLYSRAGTPGWRRPMSS